MKKYLKHAIWAIPLLLGLTFFAKHARTASTDLFTVTGRGTSWGQDIFGINSSLGMYLNNYLGTQIFGVTTAGDATLTGDMTVGDDAVISSTANVVGDIRQGTASTAHSTTTAEGIIRWCYLGGSTAAVPGHLMAASNATLGTGEGVTVVVSDNGTDKTDWIGICAVATATGSVVPVYINGFVFALTTGTVAEGNTLVSDASFDGYLKADTTPTTGADVGVALEDGVATGGLTLIRLR